MEERVEPKIAITRMIVEEQPTTMRGLTESNIEGKIREDIYKSPLKESSLMERPIEGGVMEEWGGESLRRGGEFTMLPGETRVREEEFMGRPKTVESEREIRQGAPIPGLLTAETLPLRGETVLREEVYRVPSTAPVLERTVPVIPSKEKMITEQNVIKEEISHTTPSMGGERGITGVTGALPTRAETVVKEEVYRVPSSAPIQERTVPVGPPREGLWTEKTFIREEPPLTTPSVGARGMGGQTTVEEKISRNILPSTTVHTTSTPIMETTVLPTETRVITEKVLSPSVFPTPLAPVERIVERTVLPPPSGTGLTERVIETVPIPMITEKKGGGSFKEKIGRLVGSQPMETKGRIREEGGRPAEAAFERVEPDRVIVDTRQGKVVKELGKKGEVKAPSRKGNVPSSTEQGHQHIH